jgi:transposase InsO family protein
MDFVVQLPRTAQGKDAVLVFVDRLTKMVHLAPTTTDCDAVQTAQLFVEHIIRLHGYPKDVVSDRGSVFLSNFFSHLCLLTGIKQHMSTAYHPQTDGQTERVN